VTAPLHFHTVTELAPLIAAGRLLSEDLTRACLAEIEAHDRALKAFITVLGASAIAQARALDAEIAAGRCRGPLHGIPISLKDLIDQQGVPTTAASRVREGHVAGRDAPVTARLREAGAVLVGKTNLHEFAFGTTSDDTAFGAVRNPHDPSRSPGGSSGGSAVAVVTGMSVASIGTDTGGSIRIPSAACGTVGLKPTWGEVPCDGVVPLSPSLDHVGPLARSVADAWLIYLVLRGDSTAARWPLPARRSIEGLRLGSRASTSTTCSTTTCGRGLRHPSRGSVRRAHEPWTSSFLARAPSRRYTSTPRSPKPRRGTPPRSRRRPSATRETCGCASRWAVTCSPRITSGRRLRGPFSEARWTPRSTAVMRSCCRRSRFRRRRSGHPPWKSRERVNR